MKEPTMPAWMNVSTRTSTALPMESPPPPRMPQFIEDNASGMMHGLKASQRHPRISPLGLDGAENDHQKLTDLGLNKPVVDTFG